MEKTSLLTFRKASTVPPGGYKYLDPNNEFLIVGSTLQDLINRVVVYRKANNFDVEPDLPAIIEDWICQRIPQELTSAYSKNTAPTLTNATSATVSGATQFLLKQFRLNGRKKINLEDAKKRAAICRKCPDNTKTVACASCQGLTPWIRGWIKGPIEVEEGLHICKNCALFNIAQIYVPIEVFARFTSDAMLENHPDRCWKVKELKNAKR